MLKLGKKVQYALVALFHLDRVAPGSRVNTHELSQRYAIPEQHLGKVLQRLSRCGLLSSVQGVQGGYELRRALSDIRLGDLILAVDPEQHRPAPAGHTILTVFPACYVQGLAREVERRAIEQLFSLSLTTLLSELKLPETRLLTLEEAG
jgi:Rrf2 family protein